MSSEDKGIMLTGELRDYLVGHSIPMTDAHRGIIADTLAGAEDFSIMQIRASRGRS